MYNKFLSLIDYYKQRQDFVKCNSLIKKEIVYIFTEKIKKINKNYRYSTTTELLDEVQRNLSKNDCIFFINFYNTLNEDCSDFEKTEKLLDIYKLVIE